MLEPMRQLVEELIPHAPQMGLYLAPNIPSSKLRNALGDYADSIEAADVLALYDATLMGNAKDGALFTADRLVFQNHGLDPIHEVRYADIVGVNRQRKWIGGRRVVLKVNRGRATFDVTIDFSGRPKASDFVARFLKEAMLVVEPQEEHSNEAEDADARPTAVSDAVSDTVASDVEGTSGGTRSGREGWPETTDVKTVRARLEALRDEGVLASGDMQAMLRVLDPSSSGADTQS